MPNGGRILIKTANRVIDATAAARLEIQPGPYVSVSVSDEGVGMPPEVIARAFDPFFTTKPLGVGTGLGLSMVYGFARQSGGHAHIDSTIGQYTNVCILLPFSDVKLGEFQASCSAPSAVLGLGETILNVDDEASVRHLMGLELVELGYRILEAENGAQAVRLCRITRGFRCLSQTWDCLGA